MKLPAEPALEIEPSFVPKPRPRDEANESLDWRDDRALVGARSFTIGI